MVNDARLRSTSLGARGTELRRRLDGAVVLIGELRSAPALKPARRAARMLTESLQRACLTAYQEPRPRANASIAVILRLEKALSLSQSSLAC